MEFVVAYDIRASTNFCSLAEVFGEHRNLPDVKGQVT